MSITVTPETSVSQSAVWTSSDGLASVRVYRTSHKDSRGATGWSYYISCPTDTPNVHVGYTFATPGELVYCHDWPDFTPVDALRTLSSFIGAWAEAQRYAGSDNLDMFPVSVLGICDYAEELTIDLIDMDEMDEYVKSLAGTCRACGKPMTDTDECPASGADDRRHWPVI